MHPLFYSVEGLFTGGYHLKKLVCFVTGIIAAIRAVDDAFFLSALAYLAHAAIADVFASRGAAVTVNVLRFEVDFILFSPFLGDFFPLFIIVSLRGNVRQAIRADQSAIGYLFFHYSLSLSFPP
jgi:hypothetical protein